MEGRRFFVQGACGVSGKGVEEGVDWLVKTVKGSKQWFLYAYIDFTLFGIFGIWYFENEFGKLNEYK